MNSSTTTAGKGLLAAASQGLANLLDNCLQVRPGQSVLVIHGSDCFYDDDVITLFEAECRHRGLVVASHRTLPVTRPEEMSPKLVKLMQSTDFTVFFHSLGGMLRFVSIPDAGTLCMTFAATLEVLGSGFCTLDQRLMMDLMKNVQARMDQSKEWRITCPLGTDLRSPVVAPMSGGASGDGFTLRQFPIGSHRPMLASQMSGRLMIKWLLSTGVHRVDPFGIELTAPVCAHVTNGRITEFTGAEHDVARVKARYAQMGVHNANPDETLVLNSWHAGIHPQGYCDTPVQADFERWITLAHHNPRMVHFHSCGDFNPGEIALPVIDPTISFDGEDLWRGGDFVHLQTAAVGDLLEQHTGSRAIPAQRQDIGV
jgi:hypothetical protein